jgi:hypothetical protein
MIAAIVFSRDRAMQLDLLLTSLERNAPGIFDPVHVLWRSGPEYREGYEVCALNHPAVSFVPENDLAAQVRYLLHAADFASFFTDDDVLYRPVDATLTAALHAHPGLLCLSLRLGLNTTFCYPHARNQAYPSYGEKDDIIAWHWQGAPGDFGYPGSLDGHVFRGADLRAMLDDARFANPNRLEDVLMSKVGALGKPLMVSYRESRLVGIPANIVNTTHPNRYGEQHAYDIAELNFRYLAGERIALDELDFSGIRGAHQEIELRFE